MSLLAKMKPLFRANWKAGLTVALVSLPMSVSIGVASGSTPTAGIITAVWAGLIAAFLSDSNYNITGPAGALTGILAAFAFSQGADLLPMLAIVAGVIIFIAFLLKLNKYLVFIPSSVIHGFTLGVGLTLALGQLNFAFGLNGLPKHEAFIDNLITSISALPHLDWSTTIVFIASLVLLFVLLKKVKKVPAVILLTPFGILLGYASTHGWVPFHILTLADKFPAIKPTLIMWPHFKLTYAMISTGITVAIVAMLETLLCGKVANGMTKTRFDEHRELFGLSIANIGSGLAGGLPATAVLARTSLNVKSGGTHRIGQGINAVIIAIVSLIFLGAFKFLPLAVVAAILWFTAIRMIEVRHFIRYAEYEPSSFWIAFGVAIVMLIADPLIAIMLGSGFALFLFVERLSRGSYALRIQDKTGSLLTNTGATTGKPEVVETPETHSIMYTIKGALVYMSATSHIHNLSHLHVAGKTVILRLAEVSFIDSDGVEALDEIIESLRTAGANVLITSIPERCSFILNLSSLLGKMGAEGKIFKSATEAAESVRPKN